MVQNLLELYRHRVENGALQPDPAQDQGMRQLEALRNRLTGYVAQGKPSFISRLFGPRRPAIGIRGLYLYGGVGRGKSMMMDMFFAAAPVLRKRRVHFHAFMQEVHEGIRLARTHRKEDPIAVVAAQIAEMASLLCFDEMQVSDITDAMILGRLFEALFQRGVVMVATSNRPPEGLYENGLNRHLFLPFIDILKDHMDILHLEAQKDYRLARKQGGQPVYLTPLGPDSDRTLKELWQQLVGDMSVLSPLVFQVKGREVILPHHQGRAGWSGFADLCDRPLGAVDYLALANRLDILFLADIPQFSQSYHNQAKRFVMLIDTLYEAHVKLVCSAAVEPDLLYVQGEQVFEFARTASRLMEMRSSSYFNADRVKEIP